MQNGTEGPTLLINRGATTIVVFLEEQSGEQQINVNNIPLPILAFTDFLIVLFLFVIDHACDNEEGWDAQPADRIGVYLCLCKLQNKSCELAVKKKKECYCSQRIMWSAQKYNYTLNNNNKPLLINTPVLISACSPILVNSRESKAEMRKM